MNELLKNVCLKACFSCWLLTNGCSTEPSTAKTPSADRCQGVERAEPHRVLLDSKNIESVATIKEEPFVARPSPLKTAAAEQKAKVVGVRIVWRPASGITAERLSLLAHCDRHSPEPSLVAAHEPMCPFAVKGASTTVTSTGMAFAADIVARDPDALNEVVARARALATASGSTLGESP